MGKIFFFPLIWNLGKKLFFHPQFGTWGKNYFFSSPIRTSLIGVKKSKYSPIQMIRFGDEKSNFSQFDAVHTIISILFMLCCLHYFSHVNHIAHNILHAIISPMSYWTISSMLSPYHPRYHPTFFPQLFHAIPSCCQRYHPCCPHSTPSLPHYSSMLTMLSSHIMLAISSMLPTLVLHVDHIIFPSSITFQTTSQRLAPLHIGVPHKLRYL